MVSFKNRLEMMGWERTKAVWTVPKRLVGWRVRAFQATYALTYCSYYCRHC